MKIDGRILMTTKDLLDSRHDLLFGVQRSIRYHNRRRRFFDRFDMSVNATSLMLGSATVYGVLSSAENEKIALIAACLVSIVSAINLIIGSARQARLHSDLSKRFIRLEKKIIKVPTPKDEEIYFWTELRLDIETEEPPVLHVLDMICHNELLRAKGYSKEHFANIACYQRWFAQIMDVREHSIQVGK